MRSNPMTLLVMRRRKQRIPRCAASRGSNGRKPMTAAMQARACHLLKLYPPLAGAIKSGATSNM